MADQDFLATGLIVTLGIVLANLLAFYIVIPLAVRLCLKKNAPITLEVEPLETATA